MSYMNPVLETIQNRRSIRKFADRQLNELQLELILGAGIFAPSAHNHQPWHFSVIQDQMLIDRLNEAAKDAAASCGEALFEGMAKNKKLHIFYHAPTVVVVSYDKEAMMPLADCSAAIQNMLIAAESLGVASCWIGFTDPFFRSEKFETFRERLKVPEGYQPYFTVLLGYKNETLKVVTPKRKANRVDYIR